MGPLLCALRFRSGHVTHPGESVVGVTTVHPARLHAEYDQIDAELPLAAGDLLATRADY
jgi:hypothetical protein